VVCEQNGIPVLTMDWSWGVAANPYVSFDLSEGKVGDRIALSWTDNIGATGKLETAVQ